VDPELGGDIVELGMVRDITVKENGDVSVHFALTIASCPLRTQLNSDITRQVEALPGVSSVAVVMAEMSADEKSALMQKARWKARSNAPTTQVPASARVLAIASGKGGVGKSSVTVNLAEALADRGLTVGVLDADIAGFSIPRLLGLDQRLNARNGRIRPLEKTVGSGLLKVVSMGLIEGSGDEEAVMLRGLMLNRALQHFLEDVEWGSLDYLLIDMPPGTGDVQMGLARMLPQADMIVVTTPARAAQQVAARAVDMARRGYLRVAGIVENMSGYTDFAGNRHELFGSGGGRQLAQNTNTRLLAEICFDPEVANAGDNGTPLVIAEPQKPISVQFSRLAQLIADEIAPVVTIEGCTARMLEAVEMALGPAVIDPDGT
jgi:ATP-binding protein involved in chromosome partitioning